VAESRKWRVRPHRRRGRRVSARTRTYFWTVWWRITAWDNAAGLPILRNAIRAFETGMSVDEELRWHWVAGIVARYVWDDRSWQALSDRHVALARSGRGTQ